MNFVQACELGRTPVNSVSASVLATVLRELVTRYHQTRRPKQHFRDVQLRCGEALEIQKKKHRKPGEDEGFESDEDARSTTSSCCLVEDHVFKGRKINDALDRASPSTTSISASTDSANSSGSSDTDDVDGPSLERCTTETFPLQDVIFCHTEPRHPNTIAWVIKKKNSFFDTSARLGKSGVENILGNDSCLEVIVVKCSSLEDFKKLCDSYREISRRLKLDQYKSVNRKKPIILTTMTDTKNVKVSLSDMKVGRSSLLKASELSILNPKIMSSFKTELKNSVSLNSLLKSESMTESTPQHQDEVLKKAVSLSNIAPSKFNLLQRTDLDGIMHTEVSKTLNKSKVQKEIEGVILTDVESSARRDPIRQRQNTAAIADPKIWRPEDSLAGNPPQRPERRKYTRKKAPAPKPPVTQTILPILPEVKSKSKFYLPIDDEVENNKPLPNNSQYMRLQSWPEKDKKALSVWKPVKECERVSRKDDRTLDRRRARSVGRTSRKVPMAYRYIDITEPGSIVGGMTIDDVTEGNRRRRNSFDDMMQHKSTLKPVIKSNKKMHNKTEPKKVTFSAYATVQVVD